MGKTKENLAKSEAFLRAVLSKHFKQTRVDEKQLRRSAEALCEAIPEKK